MPQPYSPCRPPRPPSGLLARLDAKLDTSGGPESCWPFRGAHSRSGKRQVRYPHLKEGPSRGRTWRVCRLVLLREILPEGLETEAEILTWLKLADALHREEEASHTCDNSVCGNPGHLEWAVHPKNIRDAWERRNRRAQEAGA